jgi:hypothetical protein
MDASTRRVAYDSGFGLALAVMLSILLARTLPAYAAGVVGNGTPASCDESALDAALAGGGAVTFNCGLQPATISITLGYKVISQSTSIDGGGLITLSANNSGIFSVTAGQMLTLTGITIENGTTSGNGGCIYVDGGSLLLMNSVVKSCTSNANSFEGGGGIYSNNGTVTIISSTLTSNQASGGAAIESYGTASLNILNSVVYNNNAILRAGAILNYGVMTVTNSTIDNNTASGFHSGTCGGIINYGTLTINNSDVSGNFSIYATGGIQNYGTLALNGSTLNRNRTGYGLGGGLDNQGTATLNNSAVMSNTSDIGNGGGISNLGMLAVVSSTLSGNQADSGGGILNLATLIVVSSTISGNSAAAAGGIENVGTATVMNSMFSGNTATYLDGGGILNDGNGIMTLTNSTISGNSAGQRGGGISNTNMLTLTNVTLSGNSANAGGGLANYGGTVSLKNSIIANSPGGNNCTGGGIVSLSHNLSSDNSCALNATGDMTNTNPLLGPLQDNGGPTPTHALLSGSPAINHADNIGCPATDQRGISRPQAGVCDIGAYEYVFPYSTFLPLAAR